MKRITCAALVALALLPGSARAFCRATTCDASDASAHCKVDTKTQCVLSGTALFWSSSCVTFSVQSDGAPKAGVSYDAAHESVQRALDAWTQADCGGGKTPAINYMLSDAVSCTTSEYNSDHKNANIVMFREDEWPYEGGEDALGLTRVRFNIDDNLGELYDADIEINAVDEPLSVGDPKPNQVDLDSLMTHEVGHALGLAHSLNVQATMVAGYNKGTTELRTLDTDDVQGICAAYPPGRSALSSDCTPRHGFSALCGAEQPADMPAQDPGGGDTPPESKGCSLFAGKPQSDGGALALLAPLAWLAVRRRGRNRAIG